MKEEEEEIKFKLILGTLKIQSSRMHGHMAMF